MVEEVTATWDTYYILPAGAATPADRQVLDFWRDLLGPERHRAGRPGRGLRDDRADGRPRRGRHRPGRAGWRDLETRAGGVHGGGLRGTVSRARGQLGGGRRDAAALLHASQDRRRAVSPAVNHVCAWRTSATATPARAPSWTLASAPPGRRTRSSGSTAARRRHTPCVPRDGRHHTFAQFGAGTFRPGVRTHLSGSSWSTRWRWPPRPTISPRRGHRRAGPADRGRRRAVGHPVPPGRQPGQGDGPGRRPARLLRAGGGRGRRYALAWPDEAPRVADCRHPAMLGRLLGAFATGSTTSWAGRRAAGRRLRAPRTRLRRPGADRRGAYLRGAARRDVRLRGRAGGAARRVARLPPVHDVVHHHLRQRRELLAEAGLAGRCGGSACCARHHQARPRPAGDRGSDAGVHRPAQSDRTPGRGRSGSATSTRSRTGTPWTWSVGWTASRSPTWTWPVPGCGSAGPTRLTDG